MDPKLLWTTFAAVFIAEMADKTQLVTFLFAADRGASKLSVFLGAASALVLTSAIGVVAGATLAQWVNPRAMTLLAGAGFVAIGAWMLYAGMSQTPAP